MKTRAWLSVLTLGVASVGLAGCGEEPPVPTPRVVSNDVPILTPERTTEIISSTKALIDKADAAFNGEELKGRMSGPLLDLRVAQFRLRGLDSQAPITPLMYGDPTRVAYSGRAYPRNFVALTEGNGHTPTFSVYTSANPTDLYHLWAEVPLLPGATSPAIVSSRGEVITPHPSYSVKDAVAAYVDSVLGRQNAVPVEADQVRAILAAHDQGIREALKDLATVDFSAAGDADTARVFPTKDGGVAVFFYLRYAFDITKKTQGSTIVLRDAVGRLLTASPTDDRAVIEKAAHLKYGLMVGIHIPADAGKVRAFAASESTLISATRE